MQVCSCKLSYETARALQKWLTEIALHEILVLSSVQFKMVSMRSEPPYALHPISQKFPQRCLRNGSKVRLIDDGPLSSFQGRSSSASSFNASLLQAINGVMPLALCPQVVSQASQRFRSSEKQATCEGCFARQCICSVVSLHSGMSRSFRRWMLTIDTFQSGLPVPLFTFCSKLIESVRIMACVV